MPERGDARELNLDLDSLRPRGVPSPTAVLPRIVDAVGSRVEMPPDGGVRRGTDLLEALASGPRAVLVGPRWCGG